MHAGKYCVLSGVQVRVLFTLPSLVWRSQYFMNVVPQTTCKKTTTSTSLATRATKWKKMMTTSPATRCFVRPRSLQAYCCCCTHFIRTKSPGCLLRLHQNETNLKCLAVAVGPIIDSAATVAFGAQREVCARTTSHRWIPLRISQYETWRLPLSIPLDCLALLCAFQFYLEMNAHTFSHLSRSLGVAT